MTKKKILISKIGQGIILDDKATKDKRSNTNGNIGLTKLIRLLVENNPDFEFYIGSFAYKSYKAKWAKDINIVEDIKEHSLHKYDAIILIAGLTSYSNSLELGKIFNPILENKDNKFILISDDPRCLKDTIEYELFTRKPDKILTQFEGEVNLPFAGGKMEVTYIPIETVSCYKERQIINSKEQDLVIISNSSGESYDRVGKIAEVLKHDKIDKKTKVYGRLTDFDKNRLIGDFVGEITYSEVQSELQRTSFTYMVPIDKDMVTSKYIEAILNGCIPLLHPDYNFSLISKEIFKLNNKVHLWEDSELEAILLQVQDKIAINEQNQISDIVKEFENSNYQKLFVKLLYLLLVYPYTDGKYLNGIIKDIVVGKEK